MFSVHVWCFYAFAKLWVAEAIIYTNIGIFCLTQILNGFWWNLRDVIITINRWTDYILDEIVPGTWEQDTTENLNRHQMVLPRSEWLHKFHSSYGTLHLQGWRVHYTQAVAEASEDDVQSLAL